MHLLQFKSLYRLFFFFFMMMCVREGECYEEVVVFLLASHQGSNFLVVRKYKQGLLGNKMGYEEEGKM